MLKGHANFKPHSAVSNCANDGYTLSGGVTVAANSGWVFWVVLSSFSPNSTAWEDG